MKRVICLGSYQGADQVGWLLAGALDAAWRRLPKEACFEVLRCGTPAQMVAQLAGAEAAVILDAVTQLPVGCVERVDVERLASHRAWSSHGFDVRECLKLAEALGDLPPCCVLVGIGVGDADADPQPIARAALPKVMALLAAVLGPHPA